MKKRKSLKRMIALLNNLTILEESFQMMKVDNSLVISTLTAPSGLFVDTSLNIHFTTHPTLGTVKLRASSGSNIPTVTGNTATSSSDRIWNLVQTWVLYQTLRD